jgi:LacI family transcriptional regulator
MTGTKIEDVAKLAGVSTATVSHVLNKTRFVTDEMKRRVLGSIKNVGYTPNSRLVLLNPSFRVMRSPLIQELSPKHYFEQNDCR